MNNPLPIFEKAIKELNLSSIIDIACGKGQYSIIAKKYFKSVYAIDSRIERVPIDIFKKNKITFKQINLEDLGIINEDVCLLSGIFYHLDIGQQMNLLSKIHSKIIFLNTHIKNDSSNIEFGLQTGLKTDNIDFNIYKEGNNRAVRPMASMNNYFSVWHTEESLQNLFSIYGYSKFIKIGKITDNRYFYKIQ